MSLERLYSVVRKENLHEGVATSITVGKHLIEARLYGGILINLRSGTLSLEQMIGSLVSDDIVEVSAAVASVDIEEVQPLVVAMTFPACSPFVLCTDEHSAQRLLGLLRVLEYLVESGAEGFEAFDVVCEEIGKAYPKFSLDGSTVRDRISEFSNDFLIAYPFANGDPVPSERRLIPGWIFDRLKMSESAFRDIFIYYIFFGAVFMPVIRTIVKKETGLGAKVGHARMSKVIYNAAAKNAGVTIFRGASMAGELKLICHAEKKTGILITQADLDRLGIRDGDTVSLIFREKVEGEDGRHYKFLKSGT